MIVERFNKIKSIIDKLVPKKSVNIVAINKTFKLEYIKPLIDYGHKFWWKQSTRGNGKMEWTKEIK